MAGMQDVTTTQYINCRRNFVYYKLLRKILKIVSNKDFSILDIGSFKVDLISDLNFKERVSVSLEEPINNKFVKGYTMDFMDFKSDTKFDVVTAFQVIEHVINAKEFTQKIFNSGNIIIISLPYKWASYTTSQHVHDPIDEEKLYSWTGKKPVFTYYCYDELPRFICVYGNVSSYFLKLLFLPKKIVNKKYKKGNYYEDILHKIYLLFTIINN